MRTAIAFVLVMSASAPAARADDKPRIDAAATSEPPSAHLIYAEVLGKGGAYGIGYEYTLTPWLALGAAGSFSMIRDQQVITVAPYLHVTLLQRGPHALFHELGAILAHSRIRSAVPDWNGMSDTGGGGLLSVGYEHGSAHLVLRTTASIAVGEGGAAPMLGFSIGWRP